MMNEKFFLRDCQSLSNLQLVQFHIEVVFSDFSRVLFFVAKFCDSSVEAAVDASLTFIE